MEKPQTLAALVAAAERLPDEGTSRTCERGGFTFRASVIFDGPTLYHAWYFGDILAKKGAAIKTVELPRKTA